MYLRRYLIGKAFHSQKYLIKEVLTSVNLAKCKHYSGLSTNFQKCNYYAYKDSFSLLQNSILLPTSQLRKCYSKGLGDEELSQILKSVNEQELKKITQLFPQPRVTLHELSTKTPDKIFDVHYTQNVIAPKGVRKKNVQTNDWTCTYAFLWPQKVKFVGTATSKRQASEKAATHALHHLYTNQRIDNKGNPIYDRSVIEDIQSKLNESIRVNISEQCMERIDRVWEDYEGGISSPLLDISKLTASSIFPRPYPHSLTTLWETFLHSALRCVAATQEPFFPIGYRFFEQCDLPRIEVRIIAIYETTFEDAKRRTISTATVLAKDSTIDQEEGFSEDDGIAADEVSDLSDLKVRIHPVYGRPVAPPSVAALQRRDRELKRTFERYDEELTPLPIDQYTKEISSTLTDHRVAVIVGAPGCGKSTRVAAAILRQNGARVAAIVAEPRRVAALGLAQSVAGEMGEQVGQTVGYQVRLQARLPRPPTGSILYCTSGVLLRRLQNNPGLEGCTHVFIDEAHERDVNTDVTLLLLKKALKINPDLRVVIMSATLDTEVFTRYFDSCPVIEVPGRIYPVGISHLDQIQKEFRINLPVSKQKCVKENGKPFVNCTEVAEVIKSVDRTQPEGAILVFLPGWAEIKLTRKLLEQFYDESTHLIVPVHSRLSTADQTRMFAKPIPGVRKIVLSTNIAETSITIPDVVYVIDSGAHKENRLQDGTGTSTLETVWVSQAGAKQRTGRAGRVQPGHCYRMYTAEKEADFVPHTLPEILRIPLEQTALDCKTYAPEDRIESFLSQLPEPPSKKAIDIAVDDLIDLGALTPTENLTHLGSYLSRMSLHPRLACSLLHAAICGAVVPMANIVTHCAENIEIFSDAAERREEIREIKRQYSQSSDHLALHMLQEAFENTLAENRWSGVNQWCDPKGIRKDRMLYVRSLSNLHLENVIKLGILDPTTEVEELNRFCSTHELSPSLLVSGCDVLLRSRRRVRAKGRLAAAVEVATSTGDRAHIATGSVNHAARRSPNLLLTTTGARHSTERRALVATNTSLVAAQSALLFCKGALQSRHAGDDITYLRLPKHNFEVVVPTNQADYIIRAKEMLWKTFEYYIERDHKSLDYEEMTRISGFKVRLIKAICKLLVEGNKQNVVGNINSDISSEN